MPWFYRHIQKVIDPTPPYTEYFVDPVISKYMLIEADNVTEANNLIKDRIREDLRFFRSKYYITGNNDEPRRFPEIIMPDTLIYSKIFKHIGRTSPMSINTPEQLAMLWCIFNKLYYTDPSLNMIATVIYGDDTVKRFNSLDLDIIDKFRESLT